MKKKTILKKDGTGDLPHVKLVETSQPGVEQMFNDAATRSAVANKDRYTRSWAVSYNPARQELEIVSSVYRWITGAQCTGIVIKLEGEVLFL